MKKSILLFYLILHLSVSAQQPLHYILLPTLDTTVSQFDFLSTADGGYLIPTIQAGLIGSGTTFIKTDASGFPLFAKQTSEKVEKVLTCSDGGFLLVTSSIPVVIKTDSALNILWAKKLSSIVYQFYSISAIEQDNHFYIATSAPELYFSTSHSHPTHAALIFKLDAAGNLVDQCILRDTISSNNHLTMSLPRLTPSTDGNIYLSVSALEYWAAGTCNRKPLVIKLDTDLNAIWTFGYPVHLFNSVMGLKMLANGNLLLYGDWGSNYPYCTYFTPYIQIIDSSGNVIAARTYYYPFIASHATTPSLLELPDQSILLTRGYEDTVAGHSVAHFDRLDTMGNTIQSSAFYYPYGQNFYNVNIAEPSGLEIPVSKLLMYDTLLFFTIDTNLQAACGSLPHTIYDSALTINRFSPGMEPIAFQHTFSDTTIPPMQTVPVTTLPACPLTAIPDPLISLTPAVYPVPAHDVIMIGHEIDKGKTASIKIFSMTGKEMIATSLLLPDQVDVRELSPGVYILEAATDSRISHAKIIIE